MASKGLDRCRCGDVNQNISMHTIKSHVRNIIEKLALHTRLEVANYAYTYGTPKTTARSISAINN